jgi:membrane-associated phospholipid phosphatase
LQRPIGEEEIRSLRTYITTEYSSPSGHTQGASSFYSAISIYLKKVIYFISAVIIFLVGYSRMYLGVHYPKDVIVGVILGILIFIFATILFNKIKNKPLLYYVVFIFGLIFLSFSNSPDYIKVLGTYFGFVNGLFIEKNMLILK